MSLSYYMDHNFHGAVTRELRRRGVAVVTAEEDGQRTLADPALLDRAGSLGRILVTSDRDLLAESTRRQRAGEPFAGVVYAHQMRTTVGALVHDLELMASIYDPPDIANRVEFLPF